jgi:hypothetical protein
MVAPPYVLRQAGTIAYGTIVQYIPLRVVARANERLATRGVMNKEVGGEKEVRARESAGTRYQPFPVPREV